jgi:MOSC domain-containing protein YiiM
VSIFSDSRGHTFGGWLIRVLEDGKVVLGETSAAEIKN